MELLIKRVTNLLKIKSIVTVTLTAVFAYLCVRGAFTPEQFLTVFTVVIGFYFGTQSEKRDGEATVSENAAVEEDPGTIT